MDKELHILYIEDNTDDAMLTKMTLKRAGLLFHMLIVESEAAFKNALVEFKPDLILSDHSLPGFSSSEAYRITT